MLVTTSKTWLPFAALLVSIVSLLYTGIGFRRQSKESEMQLWSSMRREFDYELKKDRRACGEAYASGKLGDHYSRIMDYFETLGFLVRTGRVDAELFDDTWGYYFSGYFQATKTYMEKDRKDDPRTYDDVFYLARRFSADPSLKKPEDLKVFFEDERRLSE